MILMEGAYAEVHCHSCAEALLLYSWSDDAYFGKMWNLQAMIIHGSLLYRSPSLLCLSPIFRGPGRRCRSGEMEIAGSEADSFVEFGWTSATSGSIGSSGAVEGGRSSQLPRFYSFSKYSAFLSWCSPCSPSCVMNLTCHNPRGWLLDTFGVWHFAAQLTKLPELELT